MRLLINIYICMILLLFVIISCKEDNIIPPTTIQNKLTDCPSRVYDEYGFKWFPYSSYTDHKVSCDLKYLICYNGVIINLQTLEKKNIYKTLKDSLISFLSKNIKIHTGPVVEVCCPYNSNYILVSCYTGTDTVGDSKRYINGVRNYIMTIEGKEIRDVTPPEYKKTGIEDWITPIWLVGSTHEIDSLLYYYYYNGIYIPQENKKITPLSFQHIYKQSISGRHWFGSYKEETQERFISIDGRKMVFPEILAECQSSCFSPDDKYFALTVQPTQDSDVRLRRYDEVWIIDLEKYFSEMPDTLEIKKIINLRKDYCMYTSDYLYIEFISNTTFAISMHPDEPNSISHLYEISVDGKIIRCLSDK